MLKRLILVVSSALLLAACQSIPQQEPVADVLSTEAAVAAEEVASLPEPVPPVEVLPPPKDLWERIRRQLRWHDVHNAQIGAARDHYLDQRDYLPVIAERSKLYLYYIVEEVEKRELPIEIALLPMVESTMNPFATSSESAAGLWQIIPSTGRYLGMEMNWWYDGRRDLRESTKTALDYLEALHAEFDDDWMLALAAYNAGKGRVARAQAANEKRGRPTNYWALDLPRETRQYVPRLIAMASIVRYTEGLNADLPTVPNEPAFEVAATGGQLELLRASELADMELRDLRKLNAGQLRWATAPNQAPELLLPVGRGARFEDRIATLSPDDRVRWQRYRIERGDSLIRIARKFDTQVGLLREVNNIRGNMIRAGDIMMIPHGAAWERSLALARSSEQNSVRRGYRVRQGDSLYVIADRFNVTIDQIINWNRLDPSKYLQPGQKLTLYVAGG
ncbi:MAG: LysM peptidoglycan-binding domain-containing protein [Pseudomonadota bacterium]